MLLLPRRVVAEGFREDLLAQLCEINLAPLELEVGRVERCPGGLVLGAVQLEEVPALQHLLGRGALARMEPEAVSQHLKRLRRRAWDEPLERLASGRRQRLDEAPASLVRHAAKRLLRRRAYCVHDHLDLLLRVPACEQRLPSEHLGEDTAGTPHIHGRSIHAPCAEDLRSPVPSRAHIFRHLARFPFRADACGAEVAYLDVVVAVH
mmetsp:Transcript_58666/g.162334  ORF Transcript_58666/g.162334 Transcript_58666/m.162334 type:complete len:207 (+) Transcript_58666:133-753(+)